MLLYTYCVGRAAPRSIAQPYNYGTRRLDGRIECTWPNKALLRELGPGVRDPAHTGDLPRAPEIAHSTHWSPAQPNPFLHYAHCNRNFVRNSDQFKRVCESTFEALDYRSAGKVSVDDAASCVEALFRELQSACSDYGERQWGERKPRGFDEAGALHLVGALGICGTLCCWGGEARGLGDGTGSGPRTPVWCGRHAGSPRPRVYPPTTAPRPAAPLHTGIVLDPLTSDDVRKIFRVSARAGGATSGGVCVCVGGPVNTAPTKPNRAKGGSHT